MDSYQPIYDAVRSKITGGDVTQAIQDYLHAANFGHYAMMAGNAAVEAANEHARPCVLFKPILSRDGDHWCALLGNNLHDGVAGFGKSPAEAMYEFDKAWHEKAVPASTRITK